MTLIERLRDGADAVEPNAEHASEPLSADALALVDASREAAARIEALEAALEPFAKAAEAIDAIDPAYPDNGAALRASFDWFVNGGNPGGRRTCATAGDLRRARTALNREEKADAN